jgi:hypothetical protein
MKSSWNTHKGTRYMYADYSQFGRNIEGLRAEVDAVDGAIEREPLDATLVLVDIRNTVTSSDVVSLMKESTARTKGRVQKLAVVGVTGMQRVLAWAVTRFSGETLHLFDSVDDAKEWLVGAGTGDDQGGGTLVAG